VGEAHAKLARPCGVNRQPLVGRKLGDLTVGWPWRHRSRRPPPRFGTEVAQVHRAQVAVGDRLVRSRR
jgi:hypothetical protein